VAVGGGIEALNSEKGNADFTLVSSKPTTETPESGNGWRVKIERTKEGTAEIQAFAVCAPGP
jgi:hypothetical protein